MLVRFTLCLLSACSIAFAGETTTTRPQEPAVAADNALRAYITRPDPTFAWKEQGRTKMLNFTAVELMLTSQTWRGTAWKHHLMVLLPQQVRHTDHALLLITGGNWREPQPGDAQQGPKIKLNAEALAVSAAIEQFGCPIVILQNVPFQPMFGDRREDALIAFTFDKFLKSDGKNPADATWPLLLPMVKSAVRAMDASAAFVQAERGLRVDSFTVTGASKRGWTTWLTAAVDPRVVAAAPMVINMLNMSVQSKHQLEVWGEFSEQIHDYVELDIPKRMQSGRGEALRRIVDPWSYRDKLTQPKLIFLGSNDPYWPCDASNFYYDDLVGEKYLTIVPNAGHDLGRDFPRIVGTLAALQQHIYGETRLPKLKWSMQKRGDEQVLSVEADRKPMTASVWIARERSTDFRQATWSQSPMREAPGGGFAYAVTPAAGEHVGVFGELVFEGKMPFYLSTNVNILTRP